MSRTARIRSLAKSNEAAALAELTAFLQEIFSIKISDPAINYDRYSLNSLNGFFRIGAEEFFFKFHQEEGEEDMSGEYYRADLIAKADLPVDLPVLKSVQPGEQILVYRKREDQRFSDVLRALDETADDALEALAVEAERGLNEKITAVAVKTLHPVTRQQVRNEPIHRLFYERLIDPATGAVPGGRYKSFYIGHRFTFPGAELSWDELSTAQLVLNGQPMKVSIGDIFNDALKNLHPDNLTGAGGIVAHGDAHNANVWFETTAAQPRLSYFDPAFAGEHVPSLLAEAKATFHNIFAHPFWLYDPQDAATIFHARAEYAGGVLSIETDWALSPIRQKLLKAKAMFFWQPFLKHLQQHNMLPGNWQSTIRSALAMSPTLVMNLRSGADRHNPVSSAIGFYVTALAGSKPVSGANMFTDFFDLIDPNN
nr:hypothetical protein [Pararhizobium sp. IMCC3301]